jgi:hypothetical protein
VVIGMVAHAPDGAAMPPADFEWFEYQPADAGKQH